MRKEYGYSEASSASAYLVAFRDFSRYLLTGPERIRRDGHFNLQTNILMPDVIEYDFVGRFESLSADFNQVLSRLDAPPNITGDYLRCEERDARRSTISRL